VDGKREYIHEMMGRIQFIRMIQTAQTVGAAFLRLEADPQKWTYSYELRQRWLTIDFDVKDDCPPARLEEVRTKLFDALEHIYRKMELFGLSPCLTHSASKGYHVWSFADADFDIGYVIGVFKEVTADCPHFEPKDAKLVLYDDEERSVLAEVDSLFKTGDGALIKVPFSKHPAKEDRFELPLAIQELRSWKPPDNPTDADWLRAVEVFMSWKQVPVFHITDAFHADMVFVKKGRPKKRIWTPPEEVVMMSDMTTGLRAQLDEMAGWCNPKSPTYLPCFARAVEWSRTKQNPFNLRTVVSRLAWHRGFSKETISRFIHDYINDEKDNRHPERMAYHVNYWIDNFPDGASYCSKLANGGSEIFCCPGPCGRTNPLEELPAATGPAFLNIPQVDPRPVREILADGMRRGVNQQWFKSTRVGGTSINVAFHMEKNKRLTIICPTTKIAETIEEGLTLAENGHTKVGALLPSNTEGCLKLKIKIEEAKDDFPDEVPALSQLPQTFRYNCHDCQFKDAFIRYSRGTVLKQSELPSGEHGGRCLYTTVIHRLADINVLVITHKKLYALKCAAEAAAANTSRPDDMIADSEMLLSWIADSDTILLDEISMMLDAPDLSVPLFTVPVEEEEKEFDLAAYVEDEFRVLSRFRSDDVVSELSDIVSGLVDEFNAQKTEDHSISIYERDITGIESRVMSRYLKRIQTFAARENKALTWLYKALLASQEGKWVILEEPDQDKTTNLKIYTLPKFKTAASEFIGLSGARIIAMDATHPIAAAQHIDKILGVPFERINIGDPNGSAALQRIIPWSINIQSPQLDNKAMGRRTETGRTWLEEELLQTLILMDQLWGVDNFVIAVPSKRAARVVKRVTKGYLEGLDIMWHRGSESVGVANDKRIMIGITAPYAPKGSHNWLKEVLYPDLLADVPHESVWRHDKSKTDFQTLSRVKSPNFDNMGRRSVYIAFGQMAHDLESMRQMNICPPELIQMAQIRDTSSRHVIPLITAWWWTEFGEELPVGEQLAIRAFLDGVTDFRVAARTISPHQLKNARWETLKRRISKHLRGAVRNT